MRKTEVKALKNKLSLDYDSKCVFVGSCFSENIAERMRNCGFNVVNNPLGVLFNPISVAHVLTNPSEILKESSFLQKDNIHLNWHANSKVYGANGLESFQEEVTKLLEDFNQNLASADVLFITFGSSFVYKYKATQTRVANCHKVVQSEFEKELLTVDEMLVVWRRVLAVLKEQNPRLRIVFTVSPVRHIKDGLIENNRSKARLFELVTALEHEDCTYFPAYELVMDECRDYAYFEADGVHPNAFAVQRVWEYFFETYFSKDTQKTMQQYLSFKHFFAHKALHPESDEHISIVQKQEGKFKDFLENHPNIKHQ
ncbi:GSCFA family protein [Lishizhenia tianjinensis]|uniref:GSCFA family protein n=1 Tax=Lishizhenia tianjinensis TaxID=477690 RepID=A0A1I6Y760_9FLAO|nr:GSCFA domain-containing protein [Lishizhenia tianjinensis]SFT46197.1 GSCFA family protein [Lishizhenia tianjinensis]